jgi:hypothetical protein
MLVEGTLSDEIELLAADVDATVTWPPWWKRLYWRLVGLAREGYTRLRLLYADLEWEGALW